MALRLAAPGTWAASLCPALFGALYCWVQGYSLPVSKAAALTLACVLLQSAVNTLNDYFDFIDGTDSRSDHMEESDSVLVYGGLSPAGAWKLGLFYLAAGAALGLPCCRGPAPLAAGLAGGAAVLLYSGGPAPLSHLPLGELLSGFVMGELIPFGVAACAGGPADFQILLWSLPFTLGISLIMMTNNGCDIEKDLRSGRRTLPALLGRRRTRRLYRVQAVLWLASLTVFPVALLGVWGAVGPVLLAAAASRQFASLLSQGLEPENRVTQMKTIAKANLLGNGSYLAALAIVLIGRSVYG